MGFDAKDFARRLADRSARLAELQTTQPNVPEGLPGFAPGVGQQLPNVQVVMAAAWVLVALKTLAGGADSVTTAPVPQTTKSLMLVVRSGGGPTATDLRGIPSQTNYFTPVGTIRGVTQIPVNGLEDAVYKLTLSAGAGATIAIYASDNIVPSISQGAQSSTRSVPITMANDQLNITPWLAPLSGIARASGAGIGTVVLVAAAVGQQIYAFGGHLEVTTAVAGSFIALEDSGSTILCHAPANVLGSIPFQFNGAKAGALGAGLQVRISGGAAAGAIDIAYSQI